MAIRADQLHVGQQLSGRVGREPFAGRITQVNADTVVVTTDDRREVEVCPIWCDHLLVDGQPTPKYTARQEPTPAKAGAKKAGTRSQARQLATGVQPPAYAARQDRAATVPSACEARRLPKPRGVCPICSKPLPCPVPGQTGAPCRKYHKGRCQRIARALKRSHYMAVYRLGHAIRTYHRSRMTKPIIRRSK